MTTTTAPLDILTTQTIAALATSQGKTIRYTTPRGRTLQGTSYGLTHYSQGEVVGPTYHEATSEDVREHYLHIKAGLHRYVPVTELIDAAREGLLSIG